MLISYFPQLLIPVSNSVRV